MLKDESSRIHLSGLSVWKEGRGRGNESAVKFLPFFLLLTALSKNLEYELSQMAVSQQY